ncbi:MAG: hypothetical protein LBB05_03255 [Puniceicoccales bacterium]|jgi:hypothetical protein|nr:hypothetical protein [Puniceicoccales bacterium]
MLRFRSSAGIFLWVFVPLAVDLDQTYGGRRDHRVRSSVAQEEQWIKNVVITTKKNRDFEYFPTILRAFRGEPYQLNRGSSHWEQRYVLGVDAEQDFAGVYAIILLNDSLKSFMGHGTLTVEYRVCNELDPRRVTYLLAEKNVVDNRQILVRLDFSQKLMKKIIAWKVCIQDRGKECVQSNPVWKKVMR